MGQLLSGKYESIKSNYRFIIIDKHFVFYRIEDEMIHIIRVLDRVLDGRTDYMIPLFGE